MVFWNGSYLCEKGFLINLEKRTDRLEKSFIELEKAKIQGVERFNAAKSENDLKPWLGCAQSHINIAKLQIQNNWEYVLYLEDDILYDVFFNSEITKDNINVNKTIDNIILDFHKLKPDIFFLGVRPEKEVQEKITNFVVKPSKIAMSHAYLGSLNYAKFLVANLKYNDPKHVFCSCQIDTFLTQLIERNSPELFYNPNLSGGSEIMNSSFLVLMTIPLIFNQGKSYSDLTKKVQDYTERVRENYEKYVDIKKLNISPFYI